ncbi:MAG: hypothetical protein WA908_09855 [Pontixanthobacter sp.]
MTAALSGPVQADIATGFSVRPIPKIPLATAAELRVSDGFGRTEIRPSAFAFTQVPPIELPLDMRGEVYAQAGYVGGDFATPFADGQARIDRPVVATKAVTLHAGVGTWGGAQKGAARLDAGPSLRADISVADIPIRVSVDYRARVAGDAAPPSGVALTVSTGF